MLVPHALPLLFYTGSLQFLRSARAAIATDAADVAQLYMQYLAPVISLGKTAKRKILLNISLSVVTKVRLAIYGLRTFVLYDSCISASQLACITAAGGSIGACCAWQVYVAGSCAREYRRRIVCHIAWHAADGLAPPRSQAVNKTAQ